MNSIIENNIDRITGACKKMQVQSLYLFGSAAREKDFTQSSDFDFVYRFKTCIDGTLLTQYDYFDLLYALEEITERRVDLVAAEKITNPYLKQTIIAEQIPVYES